MSGEYEIFLKVTGALSKLVVVAALLERGLAFIFEYEWFIRLTTRETKDPNEPEKIIRESSVRGLKGFIAIVISGVICFKYKFDILSVVFQAGDPTNLGIIITSFVVAGGSAGAISIFQGYLNISKDSRDALIAARKAEAEADKAEAEVKKQLAENELNAKKAK